MDSLIERLNAALDFFFAVDYVRLARNVGGLLSFAILHFVAYNFFASGRLSPFLDTLSFANITFVFAACYAVSNVVGRAIALLFTRLALPYFCLLYLTKKASKHVKLRVARRLQNGYNSAALRTTNHQQWLLRVNRKQKQLSLTIGRFENRFETVIIYGCRILAFVVLYLGFAIGLTFLSALFVYVLVLFLAYAMITALFNAAFAFLQSHGFQQIPEGSIGKLLKSPKGISDLMVGYVHGVFQEWRPFLKINFVLVAIIVALVLGASRAARVLDSSSYTLSFHEDGQSRVIENFVIISTSSSGIMGLDDLGGTLIFVPYDSGFLARLSPSSNGDFYHSELRDFLFGEFWNYQRVLD